MAGLRLRKNVIGYINIVGILLSIPVIGAGIWVATTETVSCVKILELPVIIVGVGILVVSIAGSIGGFCRIPWLVILYLIGMLILIMLLACLAVSIYMVTNKGSGRPAPSRVYSEYNLDDYSGWLSRRVVQSSFNWDRIKTCLSSSSSSMCAELNQSYTMAQDFFNAHITPLQSGCCKPPTECGYQFVNPTNWISPINNGADMDCLQWSNDVTKLCYSCDSCKAGLLASLKKEWLKADEVLVLILVLLICVYLFGCCDFISKTDYKS